MFVEQEPGWEEVDVVDTQSNHSSAYKYIWQACTLNEKETARADGVQDDRWQAQTITL